MRRNMTDYVYIYQKPFSGFKVKIPSLEARTVVKEDAQRIDH